MVLSHAIRQKSALYSYINVATLRHDATPSEAYPKKIFIKKNHAAQRYAAVDDWLHYKYSYISVATL